MVITLNIQGVSPEEIREACKQFAEMGINNRIVVKPEDLGISQAPAPSPDVEDSVVEKIVEEVKPVQPARRKWAYNKVKWTKEIEDFIMKRSHLTDSAITEELFRHFRVNCSTSAVNHRLQRIRANTPREIYIDGVFIKHWTD